jgi:hypothetical protein
MEEAMTKKIPEAEQTRVTRKDRDETVRKLLEARRELVPGATAFPQLPKEAIEPLRLAMIEGGWWEYGPEHPGRSKLPATCLRTSLQRLQKKGLLPPRPHGRVQGKKVVSKPKLAAKVVKLPELRHVDLYRLVIEAARTGLKVKLVVDDAIVEVSP